MSVAASAIRFFYTQTLHRPEIALAIPPRRKPRRLPHILSVEEVARVLASPRHATHRLLLMTTYAAGLRVSEVVRLQLTDLDRERVMIRVDQGRRRKDGRPGTAAGGSCRHHPRHKREVYPKDGRGGRWGAAWLDRGRWSCFTTASRS